MNDYQLLGSKKDNKAATKELDTALTECAAKIKAIAEKYPECGIGDTSTDDEILDVLYSMIH